MGLEVYVTCGSIGIWGGRVAGGGGQRYSGKAEAARASPEPGGRGTPVGLCRMGASIDNTFAWEHRCS